MLSQSGQGQCFDECPEYEIHKNKGRSLEETNICRQVAAPDSLALILGLATRAQSG